MRYGVAAVVVAAILGMLAATATAGAPTQGHRRLQAEHNVFRAVRVLRRWGTPFVDPKLNVVRSTTQVSCAGVGPTRANRYLTFICTMKYRSSRIRFRYTVHRRNGFGMYRLPLHPTAKKRRR